MMLAAALPACAPEVEEAAGWELSVAQYCEAALQGLCMCAWRGASSSGGASECEPDTIAAECAEAPDAGSTTPGSLQNWNCIRLAAGTCDDEDYARCDEPPA